MGPEFEKGDGRLRPSLQQRLPGAEGPPEGCSTAPRHAACGGPIPSSAEGPCVILSVVGRKNTPLLCLTLGMASLGVSWVGHLRGCNSHGGSASGRASEACGCPFAGRDRHGDPLHTDQCFWRLLLALCAIATPEAVLGEWVAMLLRQWIEPLRKLHR